MAKEKIIGIDLGTSNCAASVMQAGKPVIVPSAEGASLYGKAFPSVVAFTKDGQFFVGEPAKRQAVSNPEGTVTAAKRKMGEKFKYSIHGRDYTPQQISAFILQKIKKDAEEFIGDKISKAVITVPAYFNDDQRQATKDAGTIAGLEVIRIINEPTAAALAYGLDKVEKEEKILVFDFGGGTLDVTIMEFGGGIFEVKSTSGDTQLGGTDMDASIVNFIIKEFEKETGVDLNDDKTALQRIREAAEKAKIELSTTLESDINLPFITATNKGPKHLAMKLTRSQLEKLVDPIVQKCKKPMEQAIRDTKLKKEDIDKIILVGGPTRMPIVRLDVTPLTLGIETLGGIRTHLIERNTTIPTKKSQIFSTAADNQTSVEINVLQGEREMALDNKSLGRFMLDGIPPAPRGIPQVEVTFDIDANGIIHVSAKDLATGKQQSINITASQKLNKDEVERMKKEAEQYASEDKKRKDTAEIRNNADTLVYSTEKIVSEYGNKIDNETKDKVEKCINELKDALKENESEKIKAKYEELQKVSQEIGTKMYQQMAKEKSTSPEQGNEEKADGDNVVDAEIVEEKKKEKEKK
ncbi:molecular chaperone DnaK [Candidatus Woesearchaeota archaeon]|nr:molecular chaperone DnaK [Candidatus Woesearchaeota archaeon]